MKPNLETYLKLLEKGFTGSGATFPAFTDLGDDTLAVLVRHPNVNLELDGAVLLVNSRLCTDQAFRVSFRARIAELCPGILEADPNASPVYLTMAYFCCAVDSGHIDPYLAPLSREVSLSGLQGWAAGMISESVLSRYYCGSQQASGENIEGCLEGC